MAFSEETKLAVWKKAKVVYNADPNVWRKDQCDAWIGWNYYGDRILTSVGKLITSHLFPKEVQTTCPIFVRFNGKTMLPDRMIVCHAWLRPVVTRI